MPPKKEVEHEIQSLPNSPLPNIGLYIQSILESYDVKNSLEQFLEKGFIRPSAPPCGSPIILVTNKDETWRMCIDCKTMNSITFKNWYPFLRSMTYYINYNNVRYFTKLNLMLDIVNSRSRKKTLGRPPSNQSKICMRVSNAFRFE
jgi:hypothetical protein